MDVWIFLFRKRFADPENQAIVRKLQNEMKSHNPAISGVDIRGNFVIAQYYTITTIAMQLILDATRRFFQSKLDEKAIKAKGKYPMKVKLTCHRNRINRVC